MLERNEIIERVDEAISLKENRILARRNDPRNREYCNILAMESGMLKWVYHLLTDKVWKEKEVIKESNAVAMKKSVASFLRLIGGFFYLIDKK